MPASRQQPRQLTEHRATLTINDQIFVVIYSDAVIVIESAAQHPRINIQKKGNKAKEYQVRQALAAIAKLKGGNS